MIMNDHVSFCRRHFLTRNQNQCISTNAHTSCSRLYHMPTYTCVVMYEYAGRHISPDEQLIELADRLLFLYTYIIQR
jgi:hypothetical protein